MMCRVNETSGNKSTELIAKHSCGSDLGEVEGSLQTYSYLGGRARHVKVIGGSHGSVFGNSEVRREVRRMVVGRQ